MVISPTSTTVHVAVVGGGIAGLTAAYDLQRLGRRPVLFESRERLGGLIQTLEVDGCLLDAGPDSLLVQKPAGLALCRELGLDDELRPTLEPRTAFVLRGGRLHALPADTLLGIPLTGEALSSLTMLSPAGRDRLGEDLVRPRAPTTTDDESVGACLQRRLGPEFVAAIAQPLLGGIHAGDVDRLSIRALFPELARADTHGSLLAALRDARRAGSPDGAFRALHRGMGTLIDSLSARLPPDSVRAGSPITRITHHGLFRLVLGDGSSVEARAVVVAVPAWQAARLLHALDTTLSERCEAIPYGSSATISLAYPRDAVGDPLGGTGFVVARGEPATRLLAVSCVTSKWPGRAPGDRVLIRAFAGGTLDEDLLSLDDEALVALAHGDLRPILGLQSPPVLAKVFRWTRGSPQYEPGHLARVAGIDQAAARWPGLFLTGSGYRGVGIPDTIDAARRSAMAAHAFLNGPGA